MSLSNQENFIKKLQSEALIQSRLEQNQLLPKKLGGLGRFVINYPWQVILVASGITALVQVLIVL